MYLAVDIGGTKTLIAVFSKRGRVIRRLKFKTAQGSKTFITELTENLRNFTKYKIRLAVVAIPGVVQKNYTVKFGNRDWKDIDLFTPINSLFDCPIYFENDASLASLYEGHRRPGKTVFLTFSTGIGGGVVKDGHILPESSAFEPGHMIFTYNGETKEWEDIAAASALEAHFHVDYATDLRKHDDLKEVAKRVYLGLPSVVKEHHPDTIVLGGPLGKIFKLYIEYLPNDLGVKYVKPRRPNESVIYGCYLYARQKERE